jgi:hypothetical protein
VTAPVTAPVPPSRPAARRPRETTDWHTRLLKCALEVEASRAYWQHATAAAPGSAQQAFDEYWFGARSLRRAGVLISDMRARYAAFAEALDVLHAWRDMTPDTRRLVCHWHLQLADPMYRAFTAELLPERRARLTASVTRDAVVTWLGRAGRPAWNMATRIQFASKLLSAAHAAGLVASTRDPRPLALPSVPDDALAYVLYLLRGVDFAGTLLDNPYLGSLGLDPDAVAARIRALPEVARSLSRQGPLVDLTWRHPDLRTWAASA